MEYSSNTTRWLDRSLLPSPQKFFNIENLLVFAIIVLAIFTRFAWVGERVMSHDEVNHVVPSYDLYQGRGYQHNPVTHGPFQFHIVALSYFLFGDNDYTSRFPAALFSTLAVVFTLFAFRRYLGRTGALIAGFLFTISPYLMFYGRYTRNEAFIELYAVIMFFAMLRYLEKGDSFSMLLFTFSNVMHVITKETSFIYIAINLVFLGLVFLVEVRRLLHDRPAAYNRFLLLMGIALLLIILALGLAVVKAGAPAEAGAPSPVTPAGETSLLDRLRVIGEAVAVAGALLAGVFGLIGLSKEAGWKQVKAIRSFSLLLVTGTLILPTLAPLPVSMLGLNPIDYNTNSTLMITAAVVVVLFALSVAIGWWWNFRQWLANAFLFYAIFTVFYTTFFTNGFGFFTGMVGALGYWASQQGVERGSQPWYYFALIQVPMYEYLAALGTLLAAYFGVRYRRMAQIPGLAPAAPDPVEIPVTSDVEPVFVDEAPQGAQVYETPFTEGSAEASEHHWVEDLYSHAYRLPVLALLLFWSVMSLIAFSIAGEKMPWLTVHIALPMLLAAGWGLGFLVDRMDWKRLASQHGVIAMLLIPVFLAALVGALGPYVTGPLPFQGNTLDQLRVTSRFLISVVAIGASAAGILYLLRGWRAGQIASLAGVGVFALLAVLTARTAYRASFIDYDYATEYLVYAHAAPGPKEILKQVEEISRRTAGEKQMKVAYSSDALYPYWWYFRDWPNHHWFQSKPTRELRDYPVIIAGEDVFGKIESVVGSNYIEYTYMRLWWPNQDYWYLTWDRLWGAVSNPEMRSAIFDIWMNRDYTHFAQLKGKEKEFTPEDWSPGAKIRMYIRKDIIAQIWEYGAAPSTVTQEELDPYLAKMITVAPAQVVGSAGQAEGQFNAPRGLKVAPDGSLYVADSRNHRIQHLSAQGDVLQTWGSFADISKGDAPGGTFFEPWDVAIAPDGSVFVTDTWNHRVQKFSADGKFIKMWGYFGQAEKPEAFWGPRGLAFDAQGRLYVMDTGNSRVVIFDTDGNYITQFGSKGFDPGQFDEPVGIAIDPESGSVFITDTWNQRVQVFIPANNGMSFAQVRAWDIAGWNGQSLDNKPFIAVSPANGHVFVTDPESPQVLEFDPQGSFIRGWGQPSDGPDGFGLASGVAVNKEGEVWVSDGLNNVLLKFKLPAP